MGKSVTFRIAGAAGAAIAASLIASSASAGNRCGGSLGVDAPTTLASVARRCNVNLSALYEANPGVDPRNVAPGTYLAIPDEIDDVAGVSSGPVVVATNNDPDTDDHGQSGDLPDDYANANQNRVRDLHEASADAA